MKRLPSVLIIVGVSTLIVPPAAYAEYDSDNRDHNEHRDCEHSEGCSDEDLSPKFYDSPVDIWVCLPGSVCNKEGDGEEESS